MTKRRVLVVEDDLALASMYRTALRFAGFDVEVAVDGLAALWQIEARRPDVIVLDLSLPRLRGEAVLTELESSSDLHALPVVVVTGGEPTPATSKAQAILRKPCDPDRLLTVIQRLCASPPPAPTAA